jgi:ABC-type transport system involved in cytochrome c biogenesis permease subunit
VHIFFAWLAYGAYSVAASLGVIHLLVGARDKNGPKTERFSSLFEKIPDQPILEDLMFKFIIFGFITHMVMIASGSIWARDLWGNYWTWDPVETWSLVSWLLYGIWIHFKVTFRWKGARMAIASILILITVLFAFWGTSIIGETAHSLDDLKLKTPEVTAPEVTAPKVKTVPAN